MVWFCILLSWCCIWVQWGGGLSQGVAQGSEGASPGAPEVSALVLHGNFLRSVSSRCFLLSLVLGKHTPPGVLALSYLESSTLSCLTMLHTCCVSPLQLMYKLSELRPCPAWFSLHNYVVRKAHFKFLLCAMCCRHQKYKDKYDVTFAPKEEAQ